MLRRQVNWMLRLQLNSVSLLMLVWRCQQAKTGVLPAMGTAKQSAGYQRRSASEQELQFPTWPGGARKYAPTCIAKAQGPGLSAQPHGANRPAWQGASFLNRHQPHHRRLQVCECARACLCTALGGVPPAPGGPVSTPPGVGPYNWPLKCTGHDSAGLDIRKTISCFN